MPITVREQLGADSSPHPSHLAGRLSRAPTARPAPCRGTTGRRRGAPTSPLPRSTRSAPPPCPPRPRHADRPRRPQRRLPGRHTRDAVADPRHRRRAQLVLDRGRPPVIRTETRRFLFWTWQVPVSIEHPIEAVTMPPVVRREGDPQGATAGAWDQHAYLWRPDAGRMVEMIQLTTPPCSAPSGPSAGTAAARHRRVGHDQGVGRSGPASRCSRRPHPADAALHPLRRGRRREVRTTPLLRAS